MTAQRNARLNSSTLRLDDEFEERMRNWGRWARDEEDCFPALPSHCLSIEGQYPSQGERESATGWFDEVDGERVEQMVRTLSPSVRRILRIQYVEWPYARGAACCLAVGKIPDTEAVDAYRARAARMPVQAYLDELVTARRMACDLMHGLSPEARETEMKKSVCRSAKPSP
jgi:hypothetical protein